MPGLLRELAGGNVREFTWVRPEEEVTLLWNEKTYQMPLFHDVLEAEEAVVLGTFQGGGYDKRAALLEHNYGKGKVLYLGGVFTRKLVTAILEYTGVIHPFERYAIVPEECEVILRRKGHKKYLFILNFSKIKQIVFLKKKIKDVDSGNFETGEITLFPFETKVYDVE